jgi:uncharacterized membrane protein
MNQPDFWRTEVWHPLSVHFPIVFLLSATFSKVLAILLSAEKSIRWNWAGDVLLYCGCIAVWISIYTGNLADPLVARKICDPMVLKQHEIAAYSVAYLFSIAAVFVFLRKQFSYLKLLQTKMFKFIIVLLMLIGTACLLYTGHLGASLVYQQGAGVKISSADCNN